MTLLNRGRTGDVTTRLPLPVSDVTKATVVETVGGQSYPIAAGGASTTGNVVLSPAPIASAVGDIVGRFNDSSLSVVAGALTTEVPYGEVLNRYNAAKRSGENIAQDEAPYDFTAQLLDGEYYVIYETGRVYYKKASGATTAVFSYLYRTETTVTLNTLVTVPYDYISLSYTGANLTTVIYKSGGAGGTTVATLTLAYSGSQLISVTKT